MYRAKLDVIKFLRLTYDICEQSQSEKNWILQVQPFFRVYKVTEKKRRVCYISLPSFRCHHKIFFFFFFFYILYTHIVLQIYTAASYVLKSKNKRMLYNTPADTSILLLQYNASAVIAPYCRNKAVLCCS